MRGECREGCSTEQNDGAELSSASANLGQDTRAIAILSEKVAKSGQTHTSTSTSTGSLLFRFF